MSVELPDLTVFEPGDWLSNCCELFDDPELLPGNWACWQAARVSFGVQSEGTLLAPDEVEG